MKKAKRCMECGHRAVTNVAKAGRKTTYKNLTLEVPADLLIPTCGNCGAEWIDAPTAKAMDSAMEAVYERVLRTVFNDALERLLGVTNQARIERAIGISIGYLSKLKTGARVPSAELVSTLVLLAKDPERRIREVEEPFLRKAG